MRQAGIVAAAGVYALEHHVDRLAEDHARARRLAEGWHAAGLPVDLDQVETNFVQLEVGALGLGARRGARAAARRRRRPLVDDPSDGRPRGDAPRRRRRGDRPRDRACAAGPRGPCRSLRRSSSGSTGWSRPHRPSSASPSVERGGRSATARCSGGGARVGRRRERRGRDPGARLPHRLDHEDVHGGLHPPAARRDGARPRRPAPRRTSPRCLPGPTVADALSHLSGFQREPPGEIWETMTPPTREELLAGLEDAERVLAPGEAWHYSNLAFGLLGEIVARRNDGEYEPALRARVLEPLGLARTGFDREAAERDRLLRRPVQRPRDRRGRPGRRRPGRCDGLALVDGRRPRPLGRLPRHRAGRRARPRDARRDGARAHDGRPGDMDPRLGARTGALPSGRPRLRRARRRDAGVPRGVCVHRPERTGAAVLCNTSAGAAPERLALDLAEAVLEELPRDTGALVRRRRPARRRRADPGPLVDRKAASSFSPGRAGACGSRLSMARPAAASPGCAGSRRSLARSWRAGSSASCFEWCARRAVRR